MDFKILFVCFVIMFLRVRCHDPRCVSIFDDKGEISNSGIIMNNGISGCRGRKGERGIPGKAGISGPPGEKGSQGIHGPPGINGSAGIQGQLGEKGRPGIHGPPGIEGATGIQGPPGEKGSPGIHGLPGVNGTTGIQGPPGQKGNQGVRGPPGINGAAGMQGLPGTKGNQGVKGESGSTDGITAFEQKIQNLITDFDRSLSLLESKLNAEIKRNGDLSRPVNCSQSNKNGSQIMSSGERVYCHQQWRVIQRRFNGEVIFHKKTWNEYKNGFGSLSTEFWIGLDKIHRLTRNGGCKLRVELGAFDGSEAYAEYSDFSIGSESDLFRLHISGYSGTAGDSIIQSEFWDNNNNMAFSTIDRDNDRSSVSCAAHEGGGRGAWWHNGCGRAYLNGRWKENLNTWESFIWWNWKQASITLKSSMMMIRCD